MPSTKSLTVHEPNQLIESFHKLDITELKLLQLCFAGIYFKNGVDRDKFYIVQLQEYAEYFELSHDSAYRAMIDASKSLKSRVIILYTKLLDPKASKTAKRIIGWVDSIEYDTKESSIKIKLHQDLVEVLNNLGRDNPYSAYLLENTRKMTSVNSIRLFRLCNKWKKAGGFSNSLEDLKHLMGFQEEEYKSWDNLRRRVIIPSVDDINKYTELDVEFFTIPRGRKIIKASFNVNNKNKQLS
jgi:plasmid replication initiation protein